MSIEVGNNMSTSSMMLQMRSMADMAQANTTPIQINNEGLPGADVKETEKVEFSNLLTSAIQQVNGIQQESKGLRNDYLMGKEGANIAEVMIASQKSSVAFGAMLEIRNKLLKAYQDVKSIRV